MFCFLKRALLVLFLVFSLSFNCSLYAKDDVVFVYGQKQSVEEYIDSASNYLVNSWDLDNDTEDYVSPFYFQSEGCAEYTGFLLLHGFFLNPSNMRDISESIKDEYKCVVLFAPIMTGHGTSSENASVARYTD